MLKKILYKCFLYKIPVFKRKILNITRCFKILFTKMRYFKIKYLHLNILNYAGPFFPASIQ